MTSEWMEQIKCQIIETVPTKGLFTPYGISFKKLLSSQGQDE